MYTYTYERKYIMIFDINADNVNDIDTNDNFTGGYDNDNFSPRPTATTGILIMSGPCLQRHRTNRLLIYIYIYIYTDIYRNIYRHICLYISDAVNDNKDEDSASNDGDGDNDKMVSPRRPLPSKTFKWYGCACGDHCLQGHEMEKRHNAYSYIHK